MSNATPIEVKETPFGTVPVAKYLIIRSVEVDPNGASARIFAQVNDTQNRPIKTDVIPLLGSDYAVWGTDDTYIYTFALNYLGLTAISF